MAKVTLLSAHGGEIELSPQRLEFSARLTPQGRLDVAAWSSGEAGWAMSWTDAEGTTRRGALAPIAGIWTMRPEQGDDDPLWALEADVLRPGETARLRGPNGVTEELRVVAVEPE